MNIQRHLNQSVQWKSKTGSDSWEGDTYGDPIEIPARVEERARVVAGVGGAEVRSVTEAYVVADVRIGDQVDFGAGFETIEARNTEVDLAGNFSHYVLFSEPGGGER
jgi:hypothetical protein